MQRRDFLKYSAISAVSLITVGLRPAGLAAGDSQSTVLSQELNSNRIRKYLDALVAAGSPAGLSLVVWRDGRPVFSHCAGRERFGDSNSRAITPASRFNVGSVTKPVTGALVLKLMEAGQLNVDDKVVQFIPEFPFRDVTLLHLMMHTSGYDPKQGIQWPKTPEEVAGYLRSIYAFKERPHVPGKVRGYWTHGYSVLMDVIQRVTGETIAQFSKRVLFEPLGMHQTSYEVRQIPAGDLVLPNTGTALMEEYRTAPPTGDSGLWTTADDLARLGQAVLTGGAPDGKRVFSEHHVNFMLTESSGGRFNCTPLFFYHGSEKAESCFGALASPEAVAHPGFTGCILLLDPPTRTVIAFVSNGNRYHDDWTNYAKLGDVILAG
jgi:CubicO group peptidase (beta-lactamase class C family)